jgi:hypothetical protein
MTNRQKPATATLRKPIGAFLIIAMIAGWAILVSTAMDSFPTMPTWASLAIYAVAGVIWIFPARHILIWMETGRWTV